MVFNKKSGTICFEYYHHTDGRRGIFFFVVMEMRCDGEHEEMH